MLPAKRQTRKKALAICQFWPSGIQQHWRVSIVGNRTPLICVAVYLLAKLKDLLRSQKLWLFQMFSKKPQRINWSTKIRLKSLRQGEVSSTLKWADGEEVQTGLSKHLCFCRGGSSRKCPKQTHCHNNRQSAGPSACSSWCIWKSN